jgi:CDP-glycerol glycerophosphotransferase (TagB/SpsB family)
VLLSDTSSVVPEFLTQHKPVVTFRNTRPGPHLLNVEHIEDVRPAIETALAIPDSLRDAIEQYANSIHPYRDGRSSQRVLEATDLALENGRRGLKHKPLNLGRRLQARMRLKYWGI